MSPRKPLRVWPGVVAAVVALVARYGVPVVMPDAAGGALLGGVAASLAILIWWLFFSRAAVWERVGAIVLMIAAMAAILQVLDKSIATGMMGFMFYMFCIPPLCIALVVWAVATRNLTGGIRWASMAATILLACGAWTLVRTNGVSGDAGADLAWRWSKTAEDKLLAEASYKLPPAPAAVETAPVTAPAAVVPAPEPAKTPEAIPAVPVVEHVKAEWPGFRGPDRNGVVAGVKIDTDWAKTPPVQMWKRPVGPGWSSFAVQGDRFYTQEQRGEEEIVACYKVSTGEPVWKHSDAARFWESNAGAGPRGTPTLSDGRVYSMGATGILNALDARTGAKIWSRNAAEDTHTKTPGWGFSSSPLVMDGMVMVATTGTLSAYDAATGKLRWSGPKTAGGYTSPQLFTIGGVPQVVLISGTSVSGFAPGDGKSLWSHPMPDGSPIVQPAMTADGDVLVSTADMGGGVGLRRLSVTGGEGGWKAEERWNSAGLKPYFNDYVVHNGHVYGVDGSILACIDVKDGKRSWKGGRYGHGQLVLLPDQDLLLVLSEEGELALVPAVADQFKELAKVPAIEGKTWNHPVLVKDVVLVRNGEQMAAFRLKGQ